MTINQYDSEALRQYRHKAAEIAELRREVGQKIGSLEPSEAKREFESLVVRTKELEEFRAQLRPKDRFMAKYNVTVNNNHTVSFVLPKGCSRIEILQEAHGVGRVITSNQLQRWENDARFTSVVTSSERICIDGYVVETCGHRRERPVDTLSRRVLEVVSGADLAVAFTLHWVATGKPFAG